MKKKVGGSQAPTGAILRTTDGGINWLNLKDSIALEGIEFLDSLHGWMYGRNLPNYVYNIMIPKDGGKSWNRVFRR